MVTLDRVAQLISDSERDRRVALTKRFPFLLKYVLGVKRFFIKAYYTYHPLYKITYDKSLPGVKRWFCLSSHSSPLYRKFNARELDEGKIKNIEIAIKKLDGVVIEPGQIFSFWKYVGRTNLEDGYYKGIVLSDGTLKEEYGGGLCQLSNLIAYMFACSLCEFVERRHHSRDVFPDSGRAIPFASGATVFYHLIDLKVKNTYTFPIRLSLRMTKTQLRGSLSSPFPCKSIIKIREEESGFFKSLYSGELYRYNKLYRVVYEKNSKSTERRITHKELLWENFAKVMYAERDITNTILSV